MNRRGYACISVIGLDKLHSHPLLLFIIVDLEPAIPNIWLETTIPTGKC